MKKTSISILDGIFKITNFLPTGSGNHCKMYPITKNAGNERHSCIFLQQSYIIEQSYNSEI